MIVEVLDHWHDAGLTAGERDDLIVLAENANDRSRLTWGPVHAPYILKRANKSSASWKNAVGKLLRKKVLTTHVPGRIGQVAVYHLTPLCPEPPHDGYKGFCTRPERVTSQMTHSEESQEEGHLSDDPQGHLSDDPEAVEGHLTDAERVTGEVTPTPLFSSSKNPSNTSPSSGAEVAVAQQETSTSPEGGGGGDSFSEETTREDERARLFVDSLPTPGRQPSKAQQEQLRQRVQSALQAGWSEVGLSRYLDISDEPNVRSAASLYLYRLRDDQLPDNEAPPALEGTDATVAGWLALAQELDPNKGAVQGQALAAKFRAEEAENLQPGRHPLPADGGMWDRAMNRAHQRMGYTPSRPNAYWDRMKADAEAGRPPEGKEYPHCGDPDCDPITRTRDKEDDRGFKYVSPCTRCHPSMQFG
ncbi:hypothetical protein [Streptomyces drozdowiczii]|uniref:hypothetical protein n=1 Tax=Streptomyces drozdowiczii TaxID=202862 RepID=UPI00403CDFA2